MMMVGAKLSAKPFLLHISFTVFTIEFTESDYSFDEGDPNAEVCLQGSGEIAQPATATVSSLQTGTATGLTHIPL